MKLDARQIERFLLDPGAARVVLLHGEDVGLIRDRASRLVRAVAGASDDPFRVAELDRDGFGRIAEEMASLSLTGGRRVVRVREAGEAVTGAVQAVLGGNAPGLLVLEAAGLTSRGKLRSLVERAGDGAAIACYALEGRALEQTIRSTLAGFEVTVEADALAWLSGQLGADQAVTVCEVEKLAIYVGRGGTADLTAARVCVGDLSGLSLEDALYAATSGDVAEADRALELAMAEGAAPVGVLRAALIHLQRLQRAAAEMTGGLSAGEAAKTVRPPLYFKRESGFVRALGLWGPQALEQANVRIWEAERACKRTGSPTEAISRSAVLGLAQRAAAARRR